MYMIVKCVCMCSLQVDHPNRPRQHPHLPFLPPGCPQESHKDGRAQRRTCGAGVWRDGCVGVTGVCGFGCVCVTVRVCVGWEGKTLFIFKWYYYLKWVCNLLLSYFLSSLFSFFHFFLLHPPPLLYHLFMCSLIRSSTQSIENQLLWNIRKVSFSILLSILLFHANHQNTDLEKKVLA